jgi:hypothetical protein
MPMQVITAQDRENYGDALINMTQRAAVEALSPELNALRAENNRLRGMAQHQQYLEIERTLDRSVPTWRDCYNNPAFAQWLSLPDELSGQTRSQLMRNAVAVGDAARVVNFYRGFLAEAGHPASAGQRSRSSATGNKPLYSREDIRKLYEQRARGAISDARWGPIEADIVKAAAEGRVVGALGRDGTELSRWAR